MAHHEFFWEAGDGLSRYAQIWRPDNEPEGVICLIHGLGEHCGRYAHMADYFVRENYALISFDLYGHGRSQGKRGHVESFDIYLADIDHLLEEVAGQFPGIPCYLYGHSFGGTLVLYFTLRRQPKLNGVILSAPGLRSSLQEQTLKIALVNQVGSILPGLALSSGLDTKRLCSDPQIVQAYNRDPLVHHRTTLGMAKESLRAIEWIFSNAAKFTHPLLIMHGIGDRLVYPSGSQELADIIPGGCTLKLWEGMQHEIHNEPEREQVFAYVLNWIRQKTPLTAQNN